MNQYILVIAKATKKPKKKFVRFKAESNEAAYRWVIEEILKDPGNEPLRECHLWKYLKIRSDFMMAWKHGPGWVFRRKSDNGYHKA